MKRRAGQKISPFLKMCLGRFFGGKNRTVSEEERAATKTLLQREESRQGRFRGGKSRAESKGEILSAPKTKDKGKNLVVIARG